MRVVIVGLFLALAPAALAQTHFTVRPRDTDPTIGQPPGTGERNNARHHLYVPLNPGPSPKLVVFLHGHGGAPDGYTDFLEVAAGQGYYVVGLSYPNTVSLREVCGDQTFGPDCYEQGQQEVWYGTDTFAGPQIDVGSHPQDSIRERLRALFDWLVDPAHGHDLEGWDEFRTAGGGIEWSRVVLAGHSAGSAYAAFIATRRGVERVVMISGPAQATNDEHSSINVADWVIPAASPLTDSSRYYGLAHLQDMDCDTDVPRIAKIRLSWAILGVPGVPRPIDYTTNYGGSHQLVTGRQLWPLPSTSSCQQGGDAHNGVVANGYSHDAYLKAAWKYMLGTP